jgi:membrane protease YdiL (CAAX protease family)
MQWFGNQFTPRNDFGGVTSIVLWIVFIWIWSMRTNAFNIFPISINWKITCCIGIALAIPLLIINIENSPVASIAGHARSPVEVMDVVLITPIAEDLLFRGMIWYLLLRLFAHHFGEEKEIVILIISSILFGLEHIGYWYLSNGTIQIHAMVHSISMIVAGACFGYFRRITRSLSVPMVVHILANDIILLFQ